MSEKFLTDPLDGYLTDSAREFIKVMQDKGMDKDLAISTLEALWDENKIYDLDE